MNVPLNKEPINTKINTLRTNKENNISSKINTFRQNGVYTNLNNNNNNKIISDNSYPLGNSILANRLKTTKNSRKFYFIYVIIYIKFN